MSAMLILVHFCQRGILPCCKFQISCTIYRGWMDICKWCL